MMEILLATNNKTIDMEEENILPGNQYQRLFNAIADAGPTPLISQMQDIITIVHEDFPKQDDKD